MGLILWIKLGLVIPKVAVVSTLPDTGNVGEVDGELVNTCRPSSPQFEVLPPE